MKKKQKIIIFDGPDGNGKTEMAKELSRILRIPYFKNTFEFKAFSTNPEEFVNMLRYADPYFLKYLTQSQASVIIDRSYPSEWVYSKQFNRETDESALSASDSSYAYLGAKIIVPHRSNYSCGDKVHSVISAEVRQSLDKLYTDFCQWTMCEHLEINVDDEDLEREMFEIRSFVGEK
jgi:cytidylate kinase